MDEMYLYALKLLRMRDHSIAMLCKKIETRFGPAPPELIQELTQKGFLNDRRFAENYAARRSGRGPLALKQELAGRGIPTEVIDVVLSQTEPPSIRAGAAAKINAWKMRLPLEPRDAARLFRALHRLGYDEDAIREELERLQLTNL